MLVFGGSTDGIAPVPAVKAVVPLLTGSAEVRFEIVPGGHLGMLTGRAARRTTWVVMDEWIDQWSTDGRGRPRRRRPPARRPRARPTAIGDQPDPSPHLVGVARAEEVAGPGPGPFVGLETASLEGPTARPIREPRRHRLESSAPTRVMSRLALEGARLAVPVAARRSGEFS